MVRLLLLLLAGPLEDRANNLADQVALSLGICATRDEERELLGEIKEERENAKIAGVIDVLELKRLQDAVVHRRKVLKELTAQLRSRKLKALGCDSDPVKLARGCVEDDADEVCQSKGMEIVLGRAAGFLEDAQQAVWARK